MKMYAIRLVDSYEMKYYTFIGPYSELDHWSTDVEGASLWISYRTAQYNLAYLRNKFPDCHYEIAQVEVPV